MVEKLSFRLNAASDRWPSCRVVLMKQVCRQLLVVRNVLSCKNILVTALEKETSGSVEAVAMMEKPDAVTTKYGELGFYLEQHVGFANMEVACLETEDVKVTQNRIPMLQRKSRFTCLSMCL